jgi:hypothetical protein
MPALEIPRFLPFATSAVLAAALAACSTTTSVTPLGLGQPSRGESCELQIVKTQQDLPSRRELIGKIESHIQRNFFLGGRATLLDDAYRELRSKAGQLGGDSVLVDDYMESSAAEMTHVHVWASVFRNFK